MSPDHGLYSSLDAAVDPVTRCSGERGSTRCFELEGPDSCLIYINGGFLVGR
jgi:hypothetical protein